MSTRFLTVLGLILLALTLVRKSGTSSMGRGPSGSIANLTLDGVRMGAHLAPKVQNGSATANVQFSWTGTTRNAAGAGISWPYRTRAMLINSVNGIPIGNALTSATQTAAFNVAQQATHIIPIPTAATVPVGTTITAIVEMEAQQSDAQGNPVAGQWVLVANAQHANALIMTSASNPATPSGSLGAVSVSQRQRVFDRSHRMLQSGRPHLQGEQLRKFFHDAAQNGR